METKDMFELPIVVVFGLSVVGLIGVFWASVVYLVWLTSGRITPEILKQLYSQYQ